MKNFEDYIDAIIKEKGLDVEGPEVVEQIKADLSDSLENRINAMIITSIPEDKIEEFSTLLESDDQEKIQKYIRTTVPDIDDKVALELAQFRAYYLA